MAELIDKHYGPFYSLKTVYSLQSVLMSQPCFSKILKTCSVSTRAILLMCLIICYIRS